jgi:hypothetical protein
VKTSPQHPSLTLARLSKIVAFILYRGSRAAKTWAPTKPVAPVRRTRGFVFVDIFGTQFKYILVHFGNRLVMDYECSAVVELNKLN